MENTSAGMDKPTLTKSQKLLYILTIIAPIMYILVLLILQINKLDEMNIPANFFSNNFLNSILLLFILLSFGSIIITYKWNIPLAQLEDNIDNRFFKNYLALNMGCSVIAVYGLMLGILWWAEYRFVPFYIVVPFIGGGMIHGFYLYSRYFLNDNIQKYKSSEKDVIFQKFITKFEPIDPSQEIFKPFLYYLNKNEKIFLNYNPNVKVILKMGTVGIVSVATFSFFMYWLFSNVFFFTLLRFLNLLLIGTGIFSVTILPVILLLNVIKLKKSMYIFTSHKIIAKDPKEIKIIPYNKILSSKIDTERIKTQDITILFEKQSEEGSISEETLYIRYIPRELNLLENLKDLIKSYEKIKNVNEFSFN